MEYRAAIIKIISAIDDEAVLKAIYSFLKGFLP